LINAAKKNHQKDVLVMDDFFVPYGSFHSHCWGFRGRRIKLHRPRFKLVRRNAKRALTPGLRNLFSVCAFDLSLTAVSDRYEIASAGHFTTQGKINGTGRQHRFGLSEPPGSSTRK